MAPHIDISCKSGIWEIHPPSQVTELRNPTTLKTELDLEKNWTYFQNIVAHLGQAIETTYPEQREAYRTLKDFFNDLDKTDEKSPEDYNESSQRIRKILVKGTLYGSVKHIESRHQHSFYHIWAFPNQHHNRNATEIPFTILRIEDKYHVLLSEPVFIDPEKSVSEQILNYSIEAPYFHAHFQEINMKTLNTTLLNSTLPMESALDKSFFNTQTGPTTEELREAFLQVSN